jgi:GGDEF domain-containing protein
LGTGLGTTRDPHPTPRNSRSSAQAPPAIQDEAFAERYLAIEFAAALRGRRLTVVLFHIDDIEKLAQVHGVPQESLVFAAFRAIKRHTRAMNLTVRVERNPGTFLSILSDVGVDGARVFVERARREMAAIRLAGRSIPVSIGVASFDHSMSDPSHMIRAAESALNRAVLRGGNRVAVLVSKLTAGTT